jgi:hypothetical protein
LVTFAACDAWNIDPHLAISRADLEAVGQRDIGTEDAVGRRQCLPRNGNRGTALAAQADALGHRTSCLRHRGPEAIRRLTIYRRRKPYCAGNCCPQQNVGWSCRVYPWDCLGVRGAAATNLHAFCRKSVERNRLRPSRGASSMRRGLPSRSWSGARPVRRSAPKIVRQRAAVGDGGACRGVRHPHAGSGICRTCLFPLGNPRS